MQRFRGDYKFRVNDSKEVVYHSRIKYKNRNPENDFRVTTTLDRSMELILANYAVTSSDLLDMNSRSG